MLRKQRQAAKVIFRFIRKQYLNRNSSSKLKSRLFRRRESISSDGKGSKGILKNKASDLSLEKVSRRASGSTGGTTGGSLGLKLKRLSDSLGRLNDSRSGSVLFDENSFDKNRALGTFEEVTDTSRARARESYQIMQKNEESGEICIMEKCFIFIGTTLEELSLMFYVMQNMIDFERRVSETDISPTKIQITNFFSIIFSQHKTSGSLNTNDLGSKIPNKFASHAQSIARAASQKKESSAETHFILEAIQNKCSLSYDQIQIKYPISELEHVLRKKTYFELDLALQGFPKISIPLPLPRMSGEYGVATLLLRTNATTILTLTNLLLLERSLLVIGTRYEEVTSCALALLELLAPFKWASAFMPVIPHDMLDFVGSPVPFIAGVVRDNELDLKIIEEDYRVQNAIADGMTILNLASGKVIVTREESIEDIVARNPCPM